jgi:hypothetical protein
VTKRDDLRELVEDIERMLANPATARKCGKEARWFIERTRAYLDGKYATIDEALGLVKKGTAP